MSKVETKQKTTQRVESFWNQLDSWDDFLQLWSDLWCILRAPHIASVQFSKVSRRFFVHNSG